MKKFRIIFSMQARDKVVARLHGAGVVQLKEISGLELSRNALSEEVFEISSLLAKFRDMGGFLGQPAEKTAKVKEFTLEQILKLAKESLDELEPNVGQLKEKSDQLSRMHQDLLSKLETLESFKEIKFPLSHLRSTDEIQLTVGRIAEEQVEEFSSVADEALAERIFISSIGTGKIITVIVACHVRDYRKLSPVLYRYDIEILEIPGGAGPPAEAIQDIEKQLAGVEKQRQDLEQAVGDMAKTKSKEVFKVMELLEIQKERLEGVSLFGYTDATTMAEGWVKIKKVAHLEKILSSATKGHQIFRTYEPEKAEVESVPIELENPKVVSDFEFVTGMYGLAKYDEIDPTPFLSFTFALFFAIALSDAGYGVALGIFMISGVQISKIFPKGLRRMMTVCAIFTVVVGILIGGWFGFGQGLWVNPIQRPIPLLKLVIFIGIFHLIAAFGLVGVIKDIFRKDWKSVIFNRLARVMLLIGFFGLGFCILGVGLHEFGLSYAFPKIGLFPAFNPLLSSESIIVAFRALFFSGLAIGVVGAIIMGKNIQEKVGGPISFIYGITGLIADVTSYSRLLALGIATGVIAFSINFILSIMWTSAVVPNLSFSPSIVIAVLAFIAIGFVFIAAHSFNIFINSLGAYIHTMRLHFAEFFGKFYESGGEKFAPFKAKRMFTQVEGGE